jgi:hypothetical protein
VQLGARLVHFSKYMCHACFVSNESCQVRSGGNIVPREGSNSASVMR